MTTYRIADDVAWVSREELDLGADPDAYLARLPDGPPLSLQGSACLVWLSIHDGGTDAEIAARTSELAGVEADDIRHDVAQLLADLVSAGVVTAEPAGGVHP